MAQMLTLATSLIPLTKKVAKDLQALSKAGTIKGYSSKYLWPEAQHELACDEGLAMETLFKRHHAATRLFMMDSPRISERFGPYYSSFFYHQGLTDFLTSLIGSQDADIILELTLDEEALTATITSPFFPSLKGESKRLEYAAEGSETITRGKPVHDEAFIQRGIPLAIGIARKEFFNFGRQAYLASSLAPGIVAFGDRDSLSLLIDRSRFPKITGRGARQDAHGTFALLDPATQDPFAIYEDDTRLFDLVRDELSGYGIEAPDLDRRFFCWQRYVDPNSL